MKIVGQISILFDHDGLSIELVDKNASTVFAQIRLNEKQTCQALSRLGYTRCKIDVRGLEKIGKKHEHKPLEFMMPNNISFGKRNDVAKLRCGEDCPDGWTPDLTFNSQNSFFKKGDTDWARTTIRRWV